MRPRRRLAPLPLVPRLLLFSVLLSTLATARTTSFDDSHGLLQYSPASAWTEVAVQEWAGGAARETDSSEASVSFAFLGEQVSLYGAASAAFVVELDGSTASAAVQRPSTSLGSATRIFLASNLDPAATHRVVLKTTSDGLLRLDRVAVAFSESVNQAPQLVAASPSTSTSPAASISSPLSPSSAPAAPTSTKTMLETSRSSTSSGAIAGAVIGSILAVTVAVFVVVVCLRRRRGAQAADEQKRSSYFSGETGRRQSRASSLFGALGGGRPRSSPIPLSAQGQAPPQRDGSPQHVAGDTIERSPHPYGFGRPPSSAVLAPPTGVSPAPSSADAPSAPASRTWAQRLARASSWRRKASRLPETQRFYGVSPTAARVGGAGLPPDPPPARPLPSVPPREMKERWREGEPRLVQGSGRRESPRASEDVPHGPPTAPVVRQVFGTALSDLDAPVVASPATHPIAASHLRKRSVPRASSSADLARPLGPPRPSAAATPLSPTSFHNPFGSTSTATTMMYPSTAPRPLPTHEPHGSLDSMSANSAHWTSSSARASSDVAGARIAHAHPVVAMQELPAARAAGGDDDDDDVPLYAVGGAVPLRVGSLRELNEARRAAPLGASSSSGPPGGSLARRPTLTLRERDGGDGGLEQDAAAATGYETQGAGPEHERARHRSAAALVEVIEELRLDDEEDNPAFFSRRERVPRYRLDQGDPRACKKGLR
ncbi:hypothetical protein JCM9279_004569 [Rhodotorula babjevae]